MVQEGHTHEPHREGEALLERPFTPTGDRALTRYLLLLGAIVSSFAMQGIANPGRWEQLILSFLLGFTLLLALHVAGAQPWVLRVAAVVVAIVVVLSVIAAARGEVDPLSTRIANGLLVTLAPPFILLGVIRTLRATQAVTLEAVIGVLCVYVLLGMFFAAVYGSIKRASGSEFFAQAGQETTASFLYFSFTTLATVGYGDLTARTNLGHTLSVSEALLGQVYLVTIVSLIVANLGRRRQAPR